MTTDDRFGRDLSAWLEKDARGRVPSHLSEVLVRSAATRQRPWWSSPSRGRPLNLATRAVPAPMPALARLVVVALLVLVLAGLALLVAGSRHPRVPAPFGPAQNGVIGADQNGDLMLANADGTGLRPVVSGPETDEGIMFSRDGRRIVFNRVESDAASTVMVADASGGNLRQLVGDTMGIAWWFDWSPSGDRLLVAHELEGHRIISVVDLDDPASLRTFQLPGLEGAGFPLWRPPDGAQVVFVGDPAGPDTAALYAVRPDGTGLHRVGPAVDLPNAYFGLELTPDGRTAVYWNLDPDATTGFTAPRIHVLDIDTGADRVRTFRPDGADESDPHLSPDGRQVLSTRWLPGNEFRLQVGPLDGSSPARLIGPTFGASGDTHAAFSPDGTQVALSLTGQTPVFIDLATGATTSGPTVFSISNWQRTAP